MGRGVTYKFCAGCGNRFTSTGHPYCSAGCSELAELRSRNKVCKRCGKEFTRRPEQAPNTRWCDGCREELQYGTCANANCGKKFYRGPKKDRKFCSHACYSASPSVLERIRKTNRKQWKGHVKKKPGKCQRCGRAVKRAGNRFCGHRCYKLLWREQHPEFVVWNKGMKLDYFGAAKPDGPEFLAGDPTPEEIARRATEIRKHWTPEEWAAAARCELR
jgi:hypothetical protein